MSLAPPMCALPLTSKGAAGIALPIPTLPVSSTVTTCDAPSYKFRISPLPLCVIAAPTVELFASTLNISTSLKVVFNVVVSPFTTKFPSIVTFPEKSPSVPL